eukprot:8595400-Prorocentrum_lima.AAC.1
MMCGQYWVVFGHTDAHVLVSVRRKYVDVIISFNKAMRNSAYDASFMRTDWMAILVGNIQVEET